MDHINIQGYIINNEYVYFIINKINNKRLITRVEKNEPKDRYIKWKIKTAINMKACKRYA